MVQKNTWILLIVAMLCFGQTAVHAQNRGKGKKGQCIGATKVTDPFPVTAEFRDMFDGDSPDRIRSDGGIYDDGTARITCGGEIEIANWESFGRMIFLDFQAPDPEPDPQSLVLCEPDCLRPETILSAPFLLRTNVYANSGDSTEDGVLLIGGAYAIPPGESRASRLKVNFFNAAGDLTLRFKPDEWLYTTSVLVTRTSTNTWEIEAAPNDVAKLMTPDYQATSGKGKRRTTGHDEGNFFMPFKIYVSR